MPGEGWHGLDITATFHAPGGRTATRVLVGSDGMVEVPPEATASAGTGKIVFAGTADGVQRISCNVLYRVSEHAPVEGGEPQPPTPGVVEQLLAKTAGDRAAAEEAANAAAQSESEAYQAAQTSLDAAVNPPRVSDAGTWEVWQPGVGYTDTGVLARGPAGDAGKAGKSAFAYAVDGGYAGTEEEFAGNLAGIDALPGKLDAPAAPPAADGKVLRVLAVNEDGTFVCEWGDAPAGGVTDVRVDESSIVSDGVASILGASHNNYGVVKYCPNFGIADAKTWSANNNYPGVPLIVNASNNDLNARNSKYKPVVPSNLDYAVKTAMCDGKGEVWTDEEQAAARERMGIPGDYELIEEIVCDGEVSLYNREMEPDGTPYDFHSIYVELEIQPQNVYSTVFFRAYDAAGAAVLYDGIATTKKAYTTYGFAGCYAHSGFYRGWMVATNIAESNSGGSTNMRINKPKNIVSPIKKILINRNNGVFFDGDKIRIYGVRA